MERRNIMAVQIGQSAGLTLDFDDVKKHGKALEDLQKNLTKIAESFGTITQKIGEADWGGFLASLLTGFGGLLLSIVAVKEAFTSFKAVIDFIKVAFITLGTSVASFIGPVLAVTAAIAALAAGFMYLWNTNETFKNGVIQVWQTIQSVIQTVVSVIASFVAEKLATIKQFWDEHGAQVMEAVSNVFNFILSIIEPIMNGILALMKFVWPFVAALIQQVWGNIKGVISGALDIIMGLIKTFAGLFTGDFSLMWEGIKQLFFGALEAIWNLVQLVLIGKIVKVASTLFKSLQGVFKSMWTWISTLFLTALVGIQSYFQEQFNAIRLVVTTVMTFIRNLISTGMTAVQTVVTTILNTIRTIFMTVFNAVRSVVTSVISFIRNFITTGISAASSAVSAGLNAIRTTFLSIFNAVRTSVTTAMTAIRSAISNGIQRAFQTVMGFIGRFRDAGRNIVTSIAQGITSAIGSVTSAISNVAGKIRDFLPFSPAKEGPLQDIHRLNFGGPIKDSVEGDLPVIERALTNALSLPTIQGGNFLGRGVDRLEQHLMARQQPDFLSRSSLQDRLTVEVPVHLEGKQIARITAPFMDTELGRRHVSTMRAKGGR